MFLLLAALFALSSFNADRVQAIVFASLALLQIALIATAVSTYYSMERQEDSKIFITQIWVPLVALTLVAVVLPNLVLRERPHDEASSVGSLRTINIAQIEFARTHPDKGFASSLNELGPRSADLIDSVLASGTKSGYSFTLMTAPDSSGRTSHYSVSARPQHFSKNTSRSFLSEDSGAIHYTTDNRPATPQDPVLN